MQGIKTFRNLFPMYEKKYNNNSKSNKRKAREDEAAHCAQVTSEREIGGYEPHRGFLVEWTHLKHNKPRTREKSSGQLLEPRGMPSSYRKKTKRGVEISVIDGTRHVLEDYAKMI